MMVTAVAAYQEKIYEQGLEKGEEKGEREGEETRQREGCCLCQARSIHDDSAI